MVARTVNLLESELLGLAHEAEYHAPCDQVKSGVETDYVSLAINATIMVGESYKHRWAS
jgi:hypothetical protein